MKKIDLEYPEADDRDVRPALTQEESFARFGRWSHKEVGSGDFGDVSEADLPY